MHIILQSETSRHCTIHHEYAQIMSDLCGVPQQQDVKVMWWSGCTRSDVTAAGFLHSEVTSLCILLLMWFWQIQSLDICGISPWDSSRHRNHRGHHFVFRCVWRWRDGSDQRFSNFLRPRTNKKDVYFKWQHNQVTAWQHSFIINRPCCHFKGALCRFWGKTFYSEEKDLHRLILFLHPNKQNKNTNIFVFMTERTNWHFNGQHNLYCVTLFTCGGPCHPL